MRRILIGLMLILSSQSYGAEYPFPIMPNLQTNPGHMCDPSDNRFKGYRYSWRIPVCERHVSDGLKNRIYDAYHIPENCRGNYTIDHIIPLSIGGSNKFENLWPEHRLVKATRLQLEDQVHLAVGSGKMNPTEAVNLVRRVKFNPNLKPGRGRGQCNQ
jgi:hypothetical protein